MPDETYTCKTCGAVMRLGEIHVTAQCDCVKALQAQVELHKGGEAAALFEVRRLQQATTELQAELEKNWNALANAADYIRHSVTADNWELDPATKLMLAECLEAKREIESDDRSSLDLFDA